MPAAAVIPAPRAYTNIAVVKTLVVGCWVAGLLEAAVGCTVPVPSGMGLGGPSGWYNLQQYVPAPV